MKQIILIRHSITEQDAKEVSSQWHISEKGREKCELLAKQLAPLGLTMLISSEEPKAIETAELTAERLGITARSARGLQEHVRENVGYFESKEEFDSKMRAMFDKPDEIVFGNESAIQARNRFGLALTELVRSNPRKRLGIVTHGTVMSLFICEKNNLDGFDYWNKLGMPAYAALSLPEYEIMDDVYELGE